MSLGIAVKDRLIKCTVSVVDYSDVGDFMMVTWQYKSPAASVTNIDAA